MENKIYVYGDVEKVLRRKSLNAISAIFPLTNLEKIKPKYEGYKIKNGLLYFSINLNDNNKIKIGGGIL